MLEPWDVEHIKYNRDELAQNREVTITAYGTTTSGTDPVTGEPIRGTTNLGDFRVLWRIPNTKRQEQLLQMGYELEAADRIVKFKHDVDIAAIERIEYMGRTYRFITKDPKGIGEDPNRYEALVRLVT